MREIKFRIKDDDNNWRYGAPHNFKNINHEDYCGFGSFDGKFYDAFVKTDTLGQFTGLTDKNGNEIYEGDIVKRSNPPLKDEALYVFYNQLHACYALKSNYGCTYEPISDFGAIEVIGNIYDNPELLKVER